MDRITTRNANQDTTIDSDLTASDLRSSARLPRGGAL